MDIDNKEIKTIVQQKLNIKENRINDRIVKDDQKGS